MNELDAFLIQRITAAAFATAVLVVITLTAVPAEQLDASLHTAVGQFAWSAAFLGGRMFLDVAVPIVMRLPEAFKWRRTLFEKMRKVWTGCGVLFMTTGITSVLQHFHLDWQVYGITFVLLFSMLAGMTAASLHPAAAKQAKDEKRDEPPVDEA